MPSIGNPTGAELAKGGWTSVSVKPTGIRASRVHPDVIDGSYLAYNGKGQPALFLADMSALASGATGVEHIAALPGGGHLHYWPIVNAGAVLGPLEYAAGLRLSMDAALSEGAGYLLGGITVPTAFGVDVRNANKDAPPGKFLRVRFTITGVLNLAHLFIGFAEGGVAPDGTLTTHNELSGFSIDYSAVPTDRVAVTTYDILGGASPVTQDTGYEWGEGETHEVEVQVNGNGTVRRLFDGRVVGPAYTFADTVIAEPMIEQNNRAAGAADSDCPLLAAGALDQAGGKR